jgi:hypothetical protein
LAAEPLDAAAGANLGAATLGFTMPDKQQFREYYAGLPDDQFQMVALRPDLVPEAREAVTEELQARGLTKADLKAFRRQMKRDRVLAKRSEGVAQQQWWDLKEKMYVGFLVLFAWMSAMILPMAIREPARQWESIFIPGGFVVGSCLLGLWARKKGRHVAFVLRFVVPLVLLAISTLVVVVLS